MTLLFYEPFDAYSDETTDSGNNRSEIAFAAARLGGATGQYRLYKNYVTISGRPSGSIFGSRAAAFPGQGQFVFSGGTNSEFITYLAFYIRGDNPVLVFGSSAGITTFYIQFTTSATTIHNNVQTVFSSSASIPYNQWNFLEVRAVISSNSVTSGSVQLKNNGQLIFSASNINTNGSNRPPVLGMFRPDFLANFRENLLLVDDILILDVTGSTFNGPIGNGNFFMASYVPSSSGFYADMTSSGASTDANAINERPSNSDTSYLIATSSGPFPLRETFTLRPVPIVTFPSIPNSAIIDGVLKTSTVRSSLLDFGTFKHLLRTNSQDYTGSTAISASSTYTLTSTGWLTNPNTGNKFTVEEINNLQVGFIRES
jgi:hypothetical protein